jgi:hypothetical protein
MIADDHTYSASEIELARELLAVQWNLNVTDFLHIVAGIAHPGLWVNEAYGALVYPSKKAQAVTFPDDIARALKQQPDTPQAQDGADSLNICSRIATGSPRSYLWSKDD